jgi:hypothetical protein
LAVGQGLRNPPQDRRNVPLSRVVIADGVPEPVKGVVVDEGQDTERAILQLVEGNGARKFSQGPVQRVGVHLASRLFSPQLPPRFG